MRRLLMGLATLALTGSAGAAVQPNDPVWPDQPGPRQIGLPQVWETTTGDPSVVIATIDTGANVIPDLQDAFVPGYDFVDNDYEPQDTHGHGSRVASVIGSVTSETAPTSKRISGSDATSPSAVNPKRWPYFAMRAPERRCTA